MAEKIGWRFPPTNGGRVDRFNDPGIAHFDGNPLVSLARETIQNSLDASAGPDPVEMSFEIEQIARWDSLGRRTGRRHQGVPGGDRGRGRRESPRGAEPCLGIAAA